MKYLHTHGFTLPELMIVVAIVALLMSLAYPSYVESVQKSQRGDAQAALTGLASAMQRYHTETTPSSFVGAAASGPPGSPKSSVFPSQSPLDGVTKHYNLGIQSATASAYELRAAPISGSAQDGDKCGTLTMTSTGLRGITGGDEDVVWQDCWR